MIICFGSVNEAGVVNACFQYEGEYKMKGRNLRTEFLGLGAEMIV